FFRRILHIRGHEKVQPGVLENLAPLLHVGSFQAQHQGQIQFGGLGGFDYAAGQHVHAQDAAEDVNKDGAHVFVAQQNLEGVANRLGISAATDVKKIGRRAAGVLDDVHGGHGQPGAVDQAGNVAVKLDVIQVELGGLDFQRVFFIDVAQFFQVFVPEKRVVVKVDLGIEREQTAVGGGDEWVDLHQRGVRVDEGTIQAGHETHGLADLFTFQAQ